jgi:glycosyltransferase involved in cell wall biosynthesis
MAAVARSAAQLLVAGRPASPSLEAAIREEAQGAEDIRLLLRFVGEEEVPTIFSVADIIVLPYAGRSALNSGVAHLALSLGTAVIVNNTEANRELQSRFGPDWVWLCDGTTDDALRVALKAIASPRPEKPGLGILDRSLLGRQIWNAYREAIDAR